MCSSDLAGRTLNPDHWNAGDLWSRKSYLAASDSAQLAADTLDTELSQPYLCIIAYPKDSLSDNMTLFYIAQHNFTSYSARDFDISLETVMGVTQLRVSGFQTFEEVYSYAQHLLTDETVAQHIAGCRLILISEANLRLLGTRFSYDEYQEFYDTHLAPSTPDDTYSIDEPTDIEFIDPEDQPLNPSGQPHSPSGSGTTDDEPAVPATDDDWLL